jgi:hypothetical protein
MSKLYEPAFADPHYGIIKPAGRYITFAAGPGTPTSLSLPAAGYEKGALFQDLTNGHLYENVGTTTVAVWLQVDAVALGAIPRAQSIVALSTVGTGTITAAGIVAGVTNRTGSTAAYTDTTDTAALIIAALPTGTPVGASWVYTYYNNTLGNATLAGGSGVTLTGTGVPATCWAEYLVTYTAAGAVSMVQIATGPNVVLPASKFTTGALQSATFAAGDLTGANVVHYSNTGTTPAALTVRTAAQMFADIPNCQIGFTYTLFIRNASGSANTATITADGGATVTLSGTMTIPQNVTRMFNVTFPSATTCTITSMGTFAAGA